MKGFVNELPVAGILPSRDSRNEARGSKKDEVKGQAAVLGRQMD